nr:MAG TPA: hypothetical protein [Caudoviricetes sp.]
MILNLPLGGGAKLPYFCARNGQKLILTAIAWAYGNGLGRKG